MTAEMVDSYLEVQQTELEAPPSGGLLQLIERLNRYNSLPDIADLQSALADADITRQDLAPYWQFKAGTYARHRLLRSPHLELRWA